MVHARTPVLVGVGQLLNRVESLDQAIEPIEMMLKPCRHAERDTGAGGFLSMRCRPGSACRSIGATRRSSPTP